MGEFHESKICFNVFVRSANPGRRPGGFIPKADSAAAMEKSGDVCRLYRQYPDHSALDTGLNGKGKNPASFILAVTLWLWGTVLFANFAEAVAEGRSKAQAAFLRSAKRDIAAKKLDEPRYGANYSKVAGSNLRRGDVVLIEAGDFVPGDGEVIEGVASVDESAITGESAPVIRESGGDFSSVTGGTRVLSDWLVVRITANPGEAFLDRMISMVESAKRQKTPNEIALTILLVALTLIFLMVTVTLLPFSIYSVERRQIRYTYLHHRTGGVAGLPDSDDYRRLIVCHRRRGYWTDDAEKRDRDLRPGSGSGRRHRCIAA